MCRGLTLGDKFGRAVVYFIGILYMFLGLSIVSDRFMASIEVITSKERSIKVSRSNRGREEGGGRKEVGCR